MSDVSRRSALWLGVGAGAVFTGASAASTGAAARGVGHVDWGKRASMIAGYKTVSMRDFVYQPGAKSSNPSMANDMVCHVPQGELHVKPRGGVAFIARKGDVWTCAKGMGEDLENIGSTVAIMRIIDLIA